MLSDRKQKILKVIVGEYIATASPVASDTIAHKSGLGLSSATIRNEMGRLEEDGYIARRHTSGGGIPSDKGYRYYVESLVEEAEMPMEEQFTISHLFHQVETELEQWTGLAAALLARIAQSMAIVTSAKAVESRLKHVELVSINDFLALLIILLQEAKLKKVLLAFDEATSQEELTFSSNRLNAAFKGLTRSEITGRGLELSPVEEQVMKPLIRALDEEAEQQYAEPRIEGLRHIMLQPEFASSKKMLSLMEVVESGKLAGYIVPQTPAAGDVQVIIGAENREDAMRDCSMVVTQYGIPGEVSGFLGVLGPTRMPYGRAIAVVRYTGSLLSNLVADLHDESS